MLKVEEAALRPLLATYKRTRRELLAKLNAMAPGATQFSRVHLELLLIQVEAAIRVMEQSMLDDLVEHCTEAIASGWAETLEEVKAAELRFGDPKLAAHLEAFGQVRPVIPAQTVARMSNAQNLILRGLGERLRESIAGELAQSVAQGEGIAKATKRLRQHLDGETYQIERIARTEINNALNVGHEQAIHQVVGRFPDLDLKKQWSSHLDTRTSKVCTHLNGQVAEPHAEFEALGWSGAYPPAHVNCRSRVVPYADRWALWEAENLPPEQRTT